MTCGSGAVLILCVGVALASVHALGQEKKIYRWVDENGVVHYEDALPNDVQNVETRTLTPSPQPPARASTPTEPAIESAAATAKMEPASYEPVSEAEFEGGVDITKLSLAELDQRCDDAREAKISPLREAEIARCQADKRNDPDWCERFNADYGDGGRTQTGAVRPRMFDDLPECVDALSERNRRKR